MRSASPGAIVSSKDIQRQKAAEKAKKKRAEAARARDARVTRETGGLPTLGNMAPAFATSNWSERGAKVRVAVARETPSGHYAAALLVCDLATGEISATIDTKVPKAGWDAFVAQHGGDQTMLEVDPLVASKIVHETHRHGLALGVTAPAEWPTVRRMFELADPKDCPFEIQTGPADVVEKPAPAQKSGGILGTIKSLFGRK